MNAFGLTRDSVPAGALPGCGHGHEVCVLRRCVVSGFLVICDQCGDVGQAVDPQELIRRGWCLADIDKLGTAE